MNKVIAVDPNSAEAAQAKALDRAAEEGLARAQGAGIGVRAGSAASSPKPQDSSLSFSNELIDVGVRRLDLIGPSSTSADDRVGELPFPRQQHALHHPRKRVVRLDRSSPCSERVARDDRRCRARPRASPWRRGSTPRQGRCRGSRDIRPAPCAAPRPAAPGSSTMPSDEQTSAALVAHDARRIDRAAPAAAGSTVRDRRSTASALTAEARTTASGSAAAPINALTIAG